jgi:hypothetical protein
MFRFPNMTAPDGSIRTFDNQPSVMIPHEFNHGYNGDVDAEPLVYPVGFDGTTVSPRLKVLLSILLFVFLVDFFLHIYHFPDRSLMKVASSIFPLEKPGLTGRSLFARTLVHWLSCRATVRITLTATRKVEPIVSPRLVSEETLMTDVSVRAGPCGSRLRYLEPKSSLEIRYVPNWLSPSCIL